MSAFASPIGGSTAILDAIKRRSEGASPLQQQSPAAPTAQPVPPMAQGGGLPQQLPQGGQPMPSNPGMAPQSSDDQLIIKALSEKLKSNSDIAKAQAGLR